MVGIKLTNFEFKGQCQRDWTGVKMINARTNVVREKVTALNTELLGTMKLFWSKIMFELLRQIVALVFLVLRQK